MKPILIDLPVPIVTPRLILRPPQVWEGKILNNIRSKKIPEKLGYFLESHIKANRIKPISGEIGDTLVYTRHDLVGIPELAVTWEKI